MNNFSQTTTAISAGLVFWDWLIIALYFIFIAWVVCFFSKRQKNASDYFLGGRDIGWFAIGGSIFASNIGSEHIVGLAGQGAVSGLSLGHCELDTWGILMLGWIFAPIFYKTGIFTTPEFLEKRFNSTCRWILSIIFLVAYILTKVSVTVYAGALVFQIMLPDAFGSPQNAFWIGAAFTVIFTGIYTIFGGLRAVLYSDGVQSILLLLGSIFVTAAGLFKLNGGWSALRDFAAQNADKFSLWHGTDHPEFPWPGLLLANFIIGIWYWGADQYMVQRTLAAKNLTIARRGAIWASVLKLLPMLVFMLPGMIGAALHQQGVISLPIQKGAFCGDYVYPAMVMQLVPAGIRGMVVVSLLAALMSSLSSLFNSSASLFTCDIYPKICKNVSQRELVWVGKIATFSIVLLGLIWIPVMPLIAGGGLYNYIQNVQSFLAPCIAAVFVLGIFCPRINGTGAVWGMAAGFLCGIAKMMLQGIYGTTTSGGGIFGIIGRFNAYYASGVLFALTMLVMLAVSYCTAPPDPQRIAGYTYASIDREAIRKSISRGDVIASAVVLLLTLGIYLYFSFWTR